MAPDGRGVTEVKKWEEEGGRGGNLFFSLLTDADTQVNVLMHSERHDTNTVDRSTIAQY